MWPFCKREEPDVAKGLLAGVVAGFAATWVMSRFQEAWNEVKKAESKDSSKAGGTPESEQDAETATVKTAKAVSEKVFHHELTKDEKPVAGAAAHIAFGAITGALYGALAEEAPVVTTGGGLAYGTAVWGAADNLAVPALGLSKWPGDYPLSQNVYGLLSHLVYGSTLELARRIVRRAL